MTAYQREERIGETEESFLPFHSSTVCSLSSSCLSVITGGGWKKKDGQTHVFYISVFLTDGHSKHRATSPYASQWHWHHTGYNGVIGLSTHKAAIWCSFQSLTRYQFYILQWDTWMLILEFTELVTFELQRQFDSLFMYHSWGFVINHLHVFIPIKHYSRWIHWWGTSNYRGSKFSCCSLDWKPTDSANDGTR